MKRLSLLLCVFVLVLWSFGKTGHTTHNFEQMPAALFDLDHWDCHAWDIEWPVPKVEIIADWDTKLDGLWVQVLGFVKLERTAWAEDRKGKGNLAKQDSLLRTWQHVLDIPDSKVGFDPTELPDLINYSTDWYFKPNFEPGFHYQNDGIHISAKTAPISDSGILLIFAIGLVLIWVSRFGEKFFKN